MANNTPDFTVKTPAIAPDAIANILQRRRTIEDENARYAQEQKNGRLKRIFDAIISGQTVASNMMDMAEKRQKIASNKSEMEGQAKLENLISNPPQAPATFGSSSALADKGQFGVQVTPDQTKEYQNLVSKRKQDLSSALIKSNPKAVTEQMANQVFPTPSRTGSASQAKMFVNHEGQAVMITPDENGFFNAPEGFKDPTIARAEVFAEPRKEANKIRVEQFDESQWNKLGKTMNTLDKGAKTAVGMAAVGNQRAARALTLLDDPKMDSVLKKYVEADLAGIMQGGSPHETMLRTAGYDNLATKWGSLKQTILSKPQALEIPEIRQQLKKTIEGIIEVDNEVLDTNTGFAKESFLKAVKQDPARFNRMIAVSSKVSGLGKKSKEGPKIRPPLDSFFK